MKALLGNILIGIGIVWMIAVLAAFAADWFFRYPTDLVSISRELHSWVPLRIRQLTSPFLIPSLPGLIIFALGAKIKGEL